MTEATENEAARSEEHAVTLGPFRIRRLFQKTLFGVFALFGFIGVATASLAVYTVTPS